MFGNSRMAAMRVVVPLLLFSLLATVGHAFAQENEARAREIAGRVATLVELTAAEYQGAVSDGEVKDSAEYAEASEFLAGSLEEMSALIAARPSLLSAPLESRMSAFSAAIRERRSPQGVEAVAERLTEELAAHWGASSVRFPDRRPSAARGAGVFRTHCASCHGADGRGDGIAAAGLNPPPADLGARWRHERATAVHDFQVLSYGTPNTAMAGWSGTLTPAERWDVVSYFEALRFGAAQVAEGRSLALGAGSPIAGRVRGWTDLAQTGRLTDVDLERKVREAWPPVGGTLEPGQAAAIVAFLRASAGTEVGGLPPEDPSAIVRGRMAAIDSLLGVAVARSGSGDLAAARGAAIDAYGSFEPLEATLNARSPALLRSTESAFAAFRGALGTGELERATTELRAQLSGARGELLRDDTSPWALATQSFVIIVREGFEAILIIGAIIAFLVKTGNAPRRRSVHGGAIAAVAASFATALLLREILTVVPGRQEVLEGVTMLVAVAMLFWVSFWLISKLDHARWNRYLQTRTQRAIGAGGGLALAGVAFVAVYREGFETVLFYKALMGMAGPHAAPVVAGFMAGCVALLGIYVAFTRFGVRIPMRPFFAVTSGMLYAMAVVFAGSGVRELQEAGVVAISSVSWAPEIGLLGMYPTVQTLGVQALLITMIAGALLFAFVPGALRRRLVVAVPRSERAA